jgi:hypothetical protein
MFSAFRKLNVRILIMALLENFVHLLLISIFFYHLLVPRVELLPFGNLLSLRGIWSIRMSLLSQ